MLADAEAPVVQTAAPPKLLDDVLNQLYG
jgi:hypothetical protein